jgi:hypothetical protein
MSWRSRQPSQIATVPAHRLNHVIQVGTHLQDIPLEILQDIRNLARECIGASQFKLEWIKQEATMEFILTVESIYGSVALNRLKTALQLKWRLLWPSLGQAATPWRIDVLYPVARMWQVRSMKADNVSTDQFVTWGDQMTEELAAENGYEILSRNEMNGFYTKWLVFVVCRKFALPIPLADSETRTG